MQPNSPGLGSLTGPECPSTVGRVLQSEVGLSPAWESSLLWGQGSRRGCSAPGLGQEVQGEIQMN